MLIHASQLVKRIDVEPRLVLRRLQTAGPKKLTMCFVCDMVSLRFGLCPFRTIAGDTMNASEQALGSARDAQPTLTTSIETVSETRKQSTYSVSTWDHESENWYVREPHATKWQLRHWLRKLYAESWDHVSILIQRND
jgi:hypothetical protein